MTTAPILLEVRRGGRLESWHRGSFVLLGADGSLAAAGGSIDEPVFPRSALKPLQAAALVAAGYPGRGPDLALAAASHSGEAVHRAGARRILAAAGVDEAALRCPAALPEEPALVEYLRSGGSAAPICHNCSGKHAAMLSTCVAAGWALESYLGPAHPLQRAARAEVERAAGQPVAALAVDGCGAPAFAVSLLGLARAFAGLMARPADDPGALVRDAMRAHPELVGGTGRAVTGLMAAVPGLLAKDGAEGVWAAALPDGRAFAAKLDDGAARGRGPLLAAVLRHWGVAAELTAGWAEEPVLGGGQPVGAVAPSAELLDRLTPR